MCLLICQMKIMWPHKQNTYTMISSHHVFAPSRDRHIFTLVCRARTHVKNTRVLLNSRPMLASVLLLKLVECTR